MNNRLELDRLVMTDPLAYVVYTKSKIQDQSFEQFLISLVLTQHSRMKDLEEQVIDDEELLINKTGKIVELERKVEQLQALKTKTDKICRSLIKAEGVNELIPVIEDAYGYLEASKELDNGKV